MRKLLQVAALMVIVCAGCSKEPQSVDEMREAGKRAYVSQQFDTARQYLGKVVAQNPRDRQGLYFLGLAYSQDLKYDSALYYLGRADLLYPNDRETNLELYRIGMTTGEAEVAVKAINVLIATGDPAANYYEDLAQMHVKQEKYYIANRYFRLLLEQEPDNPQRYLDASSSLAQIDSLDLALDIIDSALVRFGPRPELRLNKALFLVAEDRYAEGERILRELVASDTANVSYKINLAHTLGLQDDKHKRREAYDLYLQLKGRVSQEFAIDSLLSVLQAELGL